MRYLLLSYTKEGYLSTQVPGDLFEGTYEVLEKSVLIPSPLVLVIELDQWIDGCLKQELLDGRIPFTGGEIKSVYPKVGSYLLSILWSLCYIETYSVMPNIRQGIWDEGFDLIYGPMLILKGLEENGY